MILTKSQIGLILASVVTLYFTWAALQNDPSEEIALPTRTLSSTSTPVNAMDKTTSFNLQTSLQERQLVPLRGDLFTAPKVVVRYTAKPQVNVKPKPVFVAAPPLPFKYFGRYQDDDKNAVLIDYRGEVTPIKVGDIVANQYKVLAINESANSVQIQFLMMPLNQIQTMQARAGQPWIIHQVK